MYRIRCIFLFQIQEIEPYHLLFFFVIFPYLLCLYYDELSIGLTYEAGGLGAISVMTAVGFFGLMKMETLIVLPRELDLPLLSYDRIHVFGKEIILLELYDTFIKPCDLYEEILFRTEVAR